MKHFLKNNLAIFFCMIAAQGFAQGSYPDVEEITFYNCDDLINFIEDHNKVIENQKLNFYSQNNCSGLVIDGVTFIHSQLSISTQKSGNPIVEGIDGLTITNCDFIDYENIALFIRGGHNNVLVDNNYFNTSRSESPEVHHDAIAATAEVPFLPYVGGDDGLVISNNKIEGRTNGIFITKCKKLLIENNCINAEISSGIKIDNLAGTHFDTVTDALIHKNTFNTPLDLTEDVYSSITLESQEVYYEVEGEVKEVVILAKYLRTLESHPNKVPDVILEEYPEGIILVDTLSNGELNEIEYAGLSYLVERQTYRRVVVRDEDNNVLINGYTKGVKVFDNWFNQPIKLHQAPGTWVENNIFDFRGVVKNSEMCSINNTGVKYIGNKFLVDDPSTVDYNSVKTVLLYGFANDYTLRDNEFSEFARFYDSKAHLGVQTQIETGFVAGTGDITYGILDWEEVPGVTYKVRYSSHPEFAYYTDKYRTVSNYGIPMNFGGTLYAKIYTVGVDGKESLASQIITVKRNDAPANFKSETAYTNTGATTTLNWSAVAGATDYIIEYDDEASFSSPTIVSQGADLTSFTLSTPFNSTYYVRLKSVVDGEESAYSRVYSFYSKAQCSFSSNSDAKFMDSANVLTTNESDEILVYPNPVSNMISIHVPDPSITNLEIKIANLMGNTVLEKEVKNDNTIDLSSLVSGVYFVFVLKGTELLTMKTIVKK